ncbi:MAG: YbbR-like domain-containing protein [Planctomycetota bacterium]|jgi:hypothetical protein
MRQFIVGLLTHHFVTKLVSLLLAIVLFVFVQQSISETQRIERLTIQFVLEAELDKTKVLLDGNIVLKDVTVRGLRETLTREMAALRSKEGFRIVQRIDAEFLRKYEQEGGIVIDAGFCRAEGIPWQLGKDYELEIKDPPTLKLVERLNRTLRPELTEEMRKRLQLPDGYKFVVSGPPVFLEPRAISVSGPASGLPPANADEILPLYVNVRELRQDLDKVGTESEARAPLVVDSIDWERSGFKPDLLKFVYIEQPIVSQDALNVALTYVCPVEIRRVSLPKLVITLQILSDSKHLNRKQLVNGEYEYSGANGRVVPKPGMDTKNFASVAIDLEVIPEWKDKAEELARYLALVVDFTSTEEVAGRVEAPIALRATRDAPARLLSEVRLARGDTDIPEAFLFQKKK